MPSHTDDEAFFDPFEREAYYKPSQKNAIEEELKKRAENDRIKAELQSQGWITTGEAHEATGYSKPACYKWSRDLLKARSPLVWEHATSHVVLLHPDFIKSKSEFYRTEKALREEGWITTISFCEKMDVSPGTYGAYASMLEKEKSPHIWKNTVTGVRFLSPAYVKQHTEYRTQYLQRVKEGWKTAQELSGMHGMSSSDITRIVRKCDGDLDAIRMKKPFDKQLLINSEIFSSFGPSADKQSALEAQGWKTGDDIADTLGVNKHTVFQWAQKSLTENSPLVWYSALPGKNVVYLFHPDYVKECESRIDSVARQLKQQGWKTIREVAGGTRISNVVLRKKAKESIAQGSDQVRQTLVDGVYYFSPAYIKKLCGKEITYDDSIIPNSEVPFTFVRDDWYTISEAAVITGLLKGNLKQRAQKIYTLDPNSKDVRKETGHYLFHTDYLQAISKTTTTAINLKQQGWLDSAEAAKSTGIIQSRIMDICRRYYEEHGEGNSFVWQSDDNYKWLLNPQYIKQLANTQRHDNRLRLAGWKTSAQMIEATDLSTTTLVTLAQQSVKSGLNEAWQNGITGHWLYSPDILLPKMRAKPVTRNKTESSEVETSALTAKVTNATKEKELYAAGWKSIADVEMASGFLPSALSKRAMKLSAEGSPNVWKNQASGVWLLHPGYAASLIKIHEKENQLLAEGWKSGNELAALIGTRPGTIYQRVSKMQQAGSNLIWQNENKGHWLIHPDYVKKAVDTVVKEKRLVSEGWVATSQLSKTLCIDMGTLARYAKKLADNDNGMAWFNEPEYIWYVHPDFVHKLTQSITKERQLEKDDWVSISTLSDATGCTVAQLTARARKMFEQKNPDIGYREVGKPYYLFSPSYKDELVAIVSKEKELRKAGWKNLTEMAELVGVSLSGLSYQVKRLEATASGLIWRDEDSGICLIDPALKEKISANMRFKKGSVSEKIGDADNKKLGADMAEKLPKKEKDR